MKNYLLYTLFLLFLTSCAIDEIPRQPLLASPLGLTAKLAPAENSTTGAQGIVLYFTAMNPEIYFSGYALYITTRKEDFSSFASDSTYFPICPTDVDGNKSQLLKNFTQPNDTKISIFIGGPMSFPEKRFYPNTAQQSPGSPDPQNPEFTLTSFINLPDGSPFIAGIKYYFAVYAYSYVDDVYSLPSNIAEIVIP